MKIEKLKIKDEKFNINAKFYYFLKHLNKVKLTDNQANQLFKICIENTKLTGEQRIKNILNFIENKIKEGSQKQIELLNIFQKIKTSIDLELFFFSLNLYIIKDLLLQEAKMRGLINISSLKSLNPLSLAYDDITLSIPYSTRVNGALLALLFFSKLENGDTNFMSKSAYDFIEILSNLAISLKKEGIEPNQIFMLMFSETIDQSIKSDSGADYEERIFSVLTSIGIDENSISKEHDKNDKSTEFDFFFDLNGKSFGIGAKKTLRERYKQFIKTSQMSDIDVMIEITLGIDLNEEKAKSIRSHGVYIFVSEEIYKSKIFLQEMNGVFSVEDLTIKTLNNL